MSDQNNKDANNLDADEIEANIEQTRTQLGDDVEAITYQLSPERYKEQLRQRTEGVQSAVSQGLTDVVDNAGEYSRRAGKGFLDRLEDDPLPVVLVALGVSVLAIGGAFSAARTEDAGAEVDLEYPADRWPEDRPTGQSDLRNSLSGPDYGRTIGDVDRAGPLSGDRELPAGGVDAYDYSSGPDIGDYRRQTYETKRGLVRLVGDHPLVMGSIITLAGVAAGLSFPTTQREDDLMGRESDRVKAQAGNVAVKSYQSAKETAKEEADNQNLSEGRSTRNAGPKVQRVAEEAAKDAKETAEREAKRKDTRR